VGTLSSRSEESKHKTTSSSSFVRTGSLHSIQSIHNQPNPFTNTSPSYPPSSLTKNTYSTFTVQFKKTCRLQKAPRSVVSRHVLADLKNQHITQVTKDPQALNNPKVEKPGTVTSDSLAAESANSGGDFASNTNPSVLSQPSRSSTAANTDTSGATTLQPAPDAEARLAQEGWSESASIKAGRDLDTVGGKPYNTTTGSGVNVGEAPSYVNSNSQAGAKAPHGKNITEGGFDSDAPNASFNNDIGGKNDPGRAALGEFQKTNAETLEDAGMADKNKGSAENSFSALGGDTSS